MTAASSAGLSAIASPTPQTYLAQLGSGAQSWVVSYSISGSMPLLCDSPATQGSRR